jgi:hypothetical protein
MSPRRFAREANCDVAANKTAPNATRQTRIQMAVSFIPITYAVGR